MWNQPNVKLRGIMSANVTEHLVYLPQETQCAAKVKFYITKWSKDRKAGETIGRCLDERNESLSSTIRLWFITVQLKKVSFPSTSTGDTVLLLRTQFFLMPLTLSKPCLQRAVTMFEASLRVSRAFNNKNMNQQFCCLIIFHILLIKFLPTSFNKAQ